MNLRSEREEKSKEFAEVKDLSSRLMKVMGIDHTRTATQTLNQETRLGRKSGNNHQTEHCNSNVKLTTDSKHGFISAAANRSGPSIKRRTTTTMESRPALKEIGINHSPSKQRDAIPSSPLLHPCGESQDLDNKESSKENEGNNFDEGEYKRSFGESDVFSSTDSHQYSENDGRFTVGEFDDTTVDF